IARGEVIGPDTDAASSLISGPVPENSALSVFLRDQVLANVLGLPCARPRFRLRRLDSNCVLRCDEEQSSTSLALKSFSLKSLWVDRSKGDRDWHQMRVGLMQREFDNIRQVRALGLDQAPLRAVHALAVNPDLGCLLVEEFASGESLHSSIRD